MVLLVVVSAACLQPNRVSSVSQFHGQNNVTDLRLFINENVTSFSVTVYFY